MIRRIVHKTQSRTRALVPDGNWVVTCSCGWRQLIENESEQYALQTAAAHRKSMRDAEKLRAQREEADSWPSWL